VGKNGGWVTIIYGLKKGGGVKQNIYVNRGGSLEI
jgi:hypothetical protein